MNYVIKTWKSDMSCFRGSVTLGFFVFKKLEDFNFQAQLIFCCLFYLFYISINSFQQHRPTFYRLQWCLISFCNIYETYSWALFPGIRCNLKIYSKVFKILLPCSSYLWLLGLFWLWLGFVFLIFFVLWSVVIHIFEVFLKIFYFLAPNSTSNICSFSMFKLPL